MNRLTFFNDALRRSGERLLLLRGPSEALERGRHRPTGLTGTRRYAHQISARVQQPCRDHHGLCRTEDLHIRPRLVDRVVVLGQPVMQLEDIRRTAKPQRNVNSFAEP